MKKTKKLIDVFDDPFNNGIFATLQKLNVPWKNDYISNELDLAFISAFGGRKISPLVDNCLDINGKLTDSKQNLIGTTIFSLYNKMWEKEYATIGFEYDPIENYSMIERHTGNDTKTDKPDEWKETKTDTPTNWTETKTDTPTNWKETSEGLKADNEATAENNVYAFNSSDPVPVSDSKANTASKNETTRTGTYQTATTSTGTYKTETEQAGTYESKTQYDTTLTRSGNIGVTTSQQMIESERQLWQWNFFQNVVFKDICKILALSVY